MDFGNEPRFDNWAGNIIFLMPSFTVYKIRNLLADWLTKKNYVSVVSVGNKYGATELLCSDETVSSMA